MFSILNRRAARAFCCMLLLGLISAVIAACSDSPRSTPRATGVSQTSATQGALAPISALPPGSENRPLLPGQSGTEYTPNGMPALSPAKGVNAEQLFAEKLKDEKARFDRLERAVTEMRREFDAIKPAIVRLSAVESDMQELLTQLQTLTGTSGGDMPAQVGMETIPDIAMEPMGGGAMGDLANSDTETSAPVVDNPIPSPPSAVPLQPEQADTTAHSTVPEETTSPPEMAQVVDPHPPQNSGGIAVTGIRSGDHDGIARLVLDMRGTGAYTANLDNAEHVLMIELPGVAWNAARDGSFSNSPLLESWSAKASGNGSLVAVQLTGNAAIVKQMTLPSADGAGSRIVIDLQ